MNYVYMRDQEAAPTHVNYQLPLFQGRKKADVEAGWLVIFVAIIATATVGCSTSRLEVCALASTTRVA